MLAHLLLILIREYGAAPCSRSCIDSAKVPGYFNGDFLKAHAMLWWPAHGKDTRALFCAGLRPTPQPTATACGRPTPSRTPPPHPSSLLLRQQRQTATTRSTAAGTLHAPMAIHLLAKLVPQRRLRFGFGSGRELTWRVDGSLRGAGLRCTSNRSRRCRLRTAQTHARSIVSDAGSD